MSIADRIQRLENNYLDLDIGKVRPEAKEIRSALDAIKQNNPQEEPVAKFHGTGKSMILRPIAQEALKGRFYTPKSFAIGSEVKKIEEQVRMVVADANMCYSFDEPERVSVRIIDIVRPIFFGICWALFIVFTPLGMPAHSLTSFTGLVFTLHMIIQSI